MANILPIEKQTAAVSALAEGMSIRSIERMTGIHRDTIMRLGVRVGEGCKRVMDDKFRNLNCSRIEVDEIWGFVGMKQKQANKAGLDGVGDVWTWIALDAETKLVPTFAVGGRNQVMADQFIEDLASRLSHRVQITSDALKAYRGAIEKAFGTDADYGTIVKSFSSSQLDEARRYSPPEVVSVERFVVSGNPSTSCLSALASSRQPWRLWRLPVRSRRCQRARFSATASSATSASSAASGRGWETSDHRHPTNRQGRRDSRGTPALSRRQRQQSRPDTLG